MAAGDPGARVYSSDSTLRQYVRAWRMGSRRPGRRRRSDDTTTTPADRRRFSPRQTYWLFLRPVEDLGAKERVYREALCQESATIATAQRLVSDFGRIARMRGDGARRMVELGESQPYS